jgi:Tim44-like domain
MDFVYALFCQIYRTQGRDEIQHLSVFVSDALLQEFRLSHLQPVEDVVVNGIHWNDITKHDNGDDYIELLIEANYTLPLQGKISHYAVNERWILSRHKKVLSLEPCKMLVLCCPLCGASPQFNRINGKCTTCKGKVAQGEKQWYLQNRVITQATLLEPDNLVHYNHYTPPTLPPRSQHDWILQLGRLQVGFYNQQKLHQFGSWEEYFTAFQNQIVRPYFVSIYQNWSIRNWKGVRHLLSDRLFEGNRFRTERYLDQNWFRRLLKHKIEQIALARLEVDNYYEIITVRLLVSCYDYVETLNGKLINGSKQDLRKYSEYWTFVRRTGNRPDNHGFGLGQCPQCGITANRMELAAQCGYCGTKINNGEFSWVLFAVESDDTYCV